MKRIVKTVGAVVAALVLLIVCAFAVLLAMQPDRPAARVSRPQVTMRDGVKLAVDVILPEPMPAARVPVVLFQTRYWRSLALRLPDQPGVPPIGPRDASVDRLVAAGYGVVVADVRGTGASEGTWQRPWSDQEVLDSNDLVAWIALQPFSDGRVGTAGLSYEGTTALLSATTTNPALKAVLAREIEWDLVDELIAPGGVRNLSFVEAWGGAVASLDRNHTPDFFPPSARFIATGVHTIDGDTGGAGLAKILAGRHIADVAGAVSGVHNGTDLFAGVPASTVGPSAHAPTLSKTRATVGLWGGWWDGATADAVLRADRTMPLAEAVIGPWSHEGGESASPFGADLESTVNLDAVVAFFDRHLRGSESVAHRLRWWVAGAEVWREGDVWPAAVPTTWSLASGGRLVAATAPLDVRLDVDFTATTGTNNRWMTGLLRPVETDDRVKARGLLSFNGEPLGGVLSVFGAPVLRCDVSLDGHEAALFAYLEVKEPQGPVRLLTEGVARIGTGSVEVRLRPIAFELAPGSTLRVSLAGADADTFERVPVQGPRSMTFASPCAIELPVLVQ